MRKSIILLLLVVLFAGCELTTPSRPKPKPNLCPVPYSLCPISYLQDGCVIFWDHGPLVGPIYRRTGSTLTHVAIILYVGNEPWVYEAVPPRVRRIPLGVYLHELRVKKARRPQFSWYAMRPKKAFTASALVAMKRYADSQLGRRYMIRGWWRGYEVRGIMCSQFAANVIERSGQIVSANVRESPGSLRAKLDPLYQMR